MKNAHHKGFTVIDLLLVIGILGILASIVIIAINPTKQLNDARGVSRNVAVQEIENAISQYVIDGNTVLGVPTIKANALDICQETVTGIACTDAPVSGYDFSVLTTNGEYIVSLPVDPNETGSTITGYRIYKLGSFLKVCSKVIEGDCGP
jgi:type IV pilus assembly protein PilA